MSGEGRCSRLQDFDCLVAAAVESIIKQKLSSKNNSHYVILDPRAENDGSCHHVTALALDAPRPGDQCDRSVISSLVHELRVVHKHCDQRVFVIILECRCTNVTVDNGYK